MFFELIFELIDVKTDKQIGYLGLIRDKIDVTEPNTGVSASQVKGYSWIHCNMANILVEAGTASFSVNQLILISPKNGNNLVVKNFNFNDERDNSTKYEIAKQKDDSIRFIIKFLLANAHAAVFPNVRNSRMAVS